MKIKAIYLMMTIVGFTFVARAQVGINNPNPDASAVLDITANNKGLLIPRLTTSQRDAISAPGRSLLVFDLTDGKFYFHDSDQWYALNELVRLAGSNEVSLPSGNLSIGGNITSTGAVSTASLSVTGFSANALVPTGTIVMWSGSFAAIPTGWALCDGLDGRPDLRERFLVGASSADNTSVIGTPYPPNSVGGLNTVVLTANESGIRPHTHSITDPRHNHSINNGASTYALWSSNEANAGSGSSGNEVGANTHPRETDSSLTNITINNATAAPAVNAHENRPPYYALAFIIKL